MSADVIVLPVIRKLGAPETVTMQLNLPHDIHAQLLTRAGASGENVEDVIVDLIASCVFELAEADKT